MKLGGEDKKKVAVRRGWRYGYFYDNVPRVRLQAQPAAGQPAQCRSRYATSPVNTPSAPQSAPSTQPRPLVNRNSKGDDFHPALRKKGPRTDEPQINPADIDPTLHLELLAKVQNVKIEGGQRNLFQFGMAVADVKPLAGEEPKIAMGKAYLFPKPDPPKPVDPGPAPPPPPTPVQILRARHQADR
jgi:hypothetical protein